MDGKILLLALGFAMAVGVIEAQLSHKGGNCPLRNTVSRCMPTCVSDYQCSFNQKCCPNKCGSMSCAAPSAVYTGSDGGYKGSGRDTGVYCGGVKCGPYEKCEFDRTTKRERCVRT
ncbi:waprin-Thr1 [Diachasma alloeum]|uniref:waprin-Thr1 n=1 Tax=Diachasma alloeum TaxID=454923 RepID=UPI0007384265|nr:waprin-Thr1 [Diachasma alloeum]